MNSAKGLKHLSKQSTIKPVVINCGRHSGLMVTALDSGASGLGSSLGVFLGKTLYSHSASIHPGV